MWLSSTAQQAIHAVLCIAASAEHGPVRVDEIAAVIGCPRNYLSKILHALARAGVLHSVRGPKGGFQLSTTPNKITLAQVVAPFEPVAPKRCLLGRDECSGTNPCMLHVRWAAVAKPVDTFFTRTTLASLIEGNSPASDAARDAIEKVRLSTRRRPYGSLKR